MNHKKKDPHDGSDIEARTNQSVFLTMTRKTKVIITALKVPGPSVRTQESMLTNFYLLGHMLNLSRFIFCHLCQSQEHVCDVFTFRTDG